MLAPSAAAQDTLELVNYVAGINNGNFYVGAANGVLEGNNIIMTCVDPADEVSFGQSWTVTIVPLSNPSALDNTILPGVTGLDFQADFLLSQEFDGDNPNDSEVHQAIWNFADPSAFPLTTAEQALQTAAYDGVGDYDFSQAYLLVPTQAGSNQQYAGQVFEYGAVQPTDVPEPATPWLVAIFGATALWIRSARAKRRQAVL